LLTPAEFLFTRPSFHSKEFQRCQLTADITHPREEHPSRWNGGGRGDRTGTELILSWQFYFE
jgi:hypothetical protein